MKKLWLMMVVLCLTVSVYAQQNMRLFNTPNSKTMIELEEKIRKFGEGLEKIGSTNAVSWEQKTHIRKDVMPSLFVKIEERYMKTTSGVNGTRVTKRLMPAYLLNLQNQSKKKLNKRTEYNVTFDIYSGKENFEWKFFKTYPDGSKEYHAEVVMYQTYAVHTVNGVEIIYSYREIDKKVITAIKLQFPDGTVAVGLGDVTRVERLQ